MNGAVAAQLAIVVGLRVVISMDIPTLAPTLLISCCCAPSMVRLCLFFCFVVCSLAGSSGGHRHHAVHDEVAVHSQQCGYQALLPSKRQVAISCNFHVVDEGSVPVALFDVDRRSGAVGAGKRARGAKRG